MWGCQSAPENYQTYQNSLTIHPSVSGNLEVLNRLDTANSAGFKNVVVYLRNKKTRTLATQSRVEWFDSMGNLVPSINSNWSSFNIGAKETLTRTFIAPNKSAVSYKITFRKG